MTVDVLPEALGEVRDAARYFDSLRPSKFDAFMAEWTDGVAAIRTAPHLYPPDEDAPVGSEVRTYLFPRFQRRIIYQVLDGRVVILTLAHTRNQPGYWLGRVQMP